MKTRNATSIAGLALILLGSALAQTPEAQKDWKAEAYRLTFSLYELDGGKRTNVRTFVMHSMNDSRPNYVRTGNRVPLPGEKGITYMDVGVRIECVIQRLSGPGLMINGRVEVSGLVTGEPTAGNAPVLRAVETTFGTLIHPDKPVVLGVVDDVNSKKRFEIELAVSRVE